MFIIDTLQLFTLLLFYLMQTKYMQLYHLFKLVVSTLVRSLKQSDCPLSTITKI